MAKKNISEIVEEALIKSIEAIIGSPPEREELVVQLFEKDGGQWGEIFREAGKYKLGLYPQSNGSPWNLDVEEVQKVVDLSLKELRNRLER